MNKLIEYFRLILFVSGVLIGIQIPGFVDQYGKNLSARVNEAELGLADFQRDADKFFAGDLQQLINHYKKQPDAVVSAGGQNIEQIYARVTLLKSALASFQKNFYSKYYQVAVKPVNDIRSQVWQAYTYNIMLDAAAITVGLSLGLLLAVAIEVLLLAVSASLKRLWRALRKKPSAV